MPRWHDPKLAELAKQLAYSPAEKRAEQLTSARALFATIEPAKSYPWEFILFRITGYRPTKPIDHAIPGPSLRADLAALVEFLSDTLPLLAADSPTPILDLDTLTQKFSVSTKTIQRWRRQGLLAQRYTFPDHKKRLGFLLPDIEQFAAANQSRLQKSATFRQLSSEEKTKIIRLARRLKARRHFCLKEISHLIAHHLSRSPETIRYTLRKHDQQNPALAIFPRMGDPLLDADRQSIIDLFDRGTSVETIAHRWHRTRSSIYRLVSQERTDRFKRLPIPFIDNPLFAHPDSDTIILTVLPQQALTLAQQTVAAGTNPKAHDPLVARIPNDLPPDLRALFLQPVMPQEIETDLFRRMNYLKSRAATLRDTLNPRRARSTDLADIEALLHQAHALKNQLVQANLRVCVHVARKHLRPGQNLLELISDATLWLMRAVDCYDFARPVKFSTYASYSLMKNFARDRVEQIARPDRHLLTGQDQLLADTPHPTTAANTIPDQVDTTLAHRQLLQVVQQLPTRERDLVIAHFGLDQNTPPLSLAGLAQKMNLTKTRVRQLETRPLRKLRSLIEHPTTPTLA